MGVLLLDYICKTRAARGEDLTKKVAVTTIVSSAMVDALADEYGFELRRCLTAEKGGFCRPHGGNMPAAARGCQAPHCGRNRPRHGGRFL